VAWRYTVSGSGPRFDTNMIHSFLGCLVGFCSSESGRGANVQGREAMSGSWLWSRVESCTVWCRQWDMHLMACLHGRALRRPTTA
jgi:hypothetical protein